MCYSSMIDNSSSETIALFLLVFTNPIACMLEFDDWRLIIITLKKKNDDKVPSTHFVLFASSFDNMNKFTTMPIIQLSL